MTKLTIADIREANREAGLHFFEPQTMKFFHSKVVSGVYSGPGGVFFVTSEARAISESIGTVYTVRRFSPETGVVKTADYGYLPSIDDARAFAKQLARTAPEV